MNQIAMNHSRRGSLIVLTVISFVLIAGIITLVVDVGWMYYQKIRLETAVNASWQAGFDEMGRLLNSNNGSPLSSGQEATVAARVKDVFKQNNYTDTEANELAISFSGAASYSGHLEVHSNKQVGLFFATLLNHSVTQVGASRGDNLIGSGTFDDGGMGAGIVPIGIPHGEVYSEGEAQGNKEFLGYHPFGPGETFVASKTYLLRLGVPPGGVNPDSLGANLHWASNHGSLDLGGKGGGAAEYQTYFINGYPAPVNINDRINLKSGQMEGPVDQAIAARVASGEMRVVVPIVDVPDSAGVLYELNGTNTPVRVIGFAVFDLLPPDAGRTSGMLYGNFVEYIVNPWDVTGQLH